MPSTSQYYTGGTVNWTYPQVDTNTTWYTTTDINPTSMTWVYPTAPVKYYYATEKKKEVKKKEYKQMKLFD